MMTSGVMASLHALLISFHYWQIKLSMHDGRESTLRKNKIRKLSLISVPLIMLEENEYEGVMLKYNYSQMEMILTRRKQTE